MKRYWPAFDAVKRTSAVVPGGVPWRPGFGDSAPPNAGCDSACAGRVGAFAVPLSGMTWKLWGSAAVFAFINLTCTGVPGGTVIVRRPRSAPLKFWPAFADV